MNFFVKPYLYTDRADRTEYLKAHIKRYMYTVEFKELKMDINEYFRLPLPVQEIVLETSDEIHKHKLKNLEKLRQKQRRSAGGITK